MLEKILDKFFEREDIIGTSNNTVYMKRWIVLRLFGNRFMFHKMLRADGDRCLHDHPWSFHTFILYGGYIEELPNQRFFHAKPFRLYFRPSKHAHRVSVLPKGYCWTFVVNKLQRDRKWGFFTKQGWKSHEEFLANPNKSAEWCGKE